MPAASCSASMFWVTVRTLPCSRSSLARARWAALGRAFVPGAAEIVEPVHADRIAGEAFRRRHVLDPEILPQSALPPERAKPALCRQPSPGQDDDVVDSTSTDGRRLSPCRSGRGGGGSGRRARWPSSPRRSARRGCRRKDRGAPWSRPRSRCPRRRRCGAASRSTTSASPRSGRRWAGRSRCRRECRRHCWSETQARRRGRCASRRHSPRPTATAAAKPAPISTPFTALMLISPLAMSWSSLP